MRAIFGAVPLTVSFVLGSAAHAATVKVVEDEVFIGGVDGYERVSGTTQARVGDSVMAGEFGLGQIIYANGCVITATPGAVVSVEARAPIVVQDPSGMVLASSAGSRGGLSTHHVLVGTAVAGGIGVGIYYLTKGGVMTNRRAPEDASLEAFAFRISKGAVRPFFLIVAYALTEALLSATHGRPGARTDTSRL